MRKASRVESDFSHLLERMRLRQYPETTQALAFFWLKTVYHHGYDREDWNELDRLMLDATRIACPTPESHSVIGEMRIRLRDEGLLTGEAPPPSPWKMAPASRPAPDPEALAPYFVRLLNDWLPKEVARVLIDEPVLEEGETSGMPVPAVSLALTGLLRRVQLPRTSLEALFNPGIFSARDVYPLDFEVLRDAALFLLGRTDAPEFPVLPAALLCVAPGARLASEYQENVRNAALVPGAGGEELRVPIEQAQASELLMEDQYRVASIVVTLDGRWWLAYQLQSGVQSGILYRPVDRLRIDCSADYARLRAPWLECRLTWSGPLLFPAVELFGRRWRVAQWDQDVERTWLSLASAGTLAAQNHQRRARPAFVDMDWSALENALAASVRQKSGGPVEQLRQEQLIPVGRSILALQKSTASRRLRAPEAIEARLDSVAIHAGSLQPEYGRIPWRVLPGKVRDVLLGRDLYPVLAARLEEVFEGVPDGRGTPDRQKPGLLSWARLWNRRPA